MQVNRKGLTLIEVLLTLAIFSIVIVLAASVLLDTLKVKNAIDRKKGMTGVSTGVLGKITDELKSAYSFKGRSEGLAVEDGEIDGLPADTLTFVCSAYSKLKSRDNGALIRVSYFCEEGEQGGVLNLVRSERILSAPTESEDNREVVCKGVRSFNVRYFDGEEWQDGSSAGTKETGTGAGAVSGRGVSGGRSSRSPLPEAVEVTVNFDENYLVAIPEDAMTKPESPVDEDLIFDEEGQVKGFKTVVKLPAAIM